MPITWRYTDVCGVIICYITEHLDPTNYLLNFGIIALHESRPRVILRFTLKNIRNNLNPFAHTGKYCTCGKNTIRYLNCMCKLTL